MMDDTNVTGSEEVLDTEVLAETVLGTEEIVDAETEVASGTSEVVE